MQFFPVSLGNHTYVGERTVVEALKVGSHVYIGRDCVIGKARQMSKVRRHTADHTLGRQK